MPARCRLGRPRLRDRRDKRALCAMWQGDGGVATSSADIRGKPELMSAMGLGCVKTFRSGPKLLPTGWRAPSGALVGFFCDCEVEPLLKLPEVILSDLETPRRSSSTDRRQERLHADDVHHARE